MVSVLHKDKGIVLHSFKYKDSSNIIQVLTQNQGLKSFIVNGVRKQKSSVAPASVQVMASVDIDYYHNPQSDLHRVKEIKANRFWIHLTTDIRKLSMGLFMCEYTRKSIFPHDVHEDVYQLLQDTFSDIEQHQSPWNHHIWYVLRLLDLVGLHYELNTYNLQKATTLVTEPGMPYVQNLAVNMDEFIQTLHTTPLDQCHTLTLPQKMKHILLTDLTRHLIKHLPQGSQTFKSLDILMDLFE